ncbi:transport integral membrane protein [Pilimelia terevasa]|uniref:Transport integral membrane protein n=1 Tax=Pilimelia terevasa TaxID=53372 RepID=A0A8J3FKM0_9ACTN|nr:copper resistance protein CopC [Pilimelia terevasa]GGK28983.1 transport integral membrane protein [Pilimelia terevasa]
MNRLRRLPWAAAAAVAVLAGALSVLAGPARPASAHAVLTAATPAQGSVVPRAPATVELVFNEPVSPVPGRTQVVAPDGKRISLGDPVSNGQRMSLAIRPADRPLGTYVVSYRIVSADSHTISGAFAFSVGAPSAAPPRAEDTGVDPAVEAASAAARYVGYVGLTLAVGPLLLLLVLWPRRLSRRGPLRMVGTGFGLLAAATLASLWLQAPYSSGAGMFDVSATELRQVALSRFGVVLLARLVLIAAAAALVRPVLRAKGTGPARIALAAIVVAGSATWPLAGHQVASPLWAGMVAADMVHLVSMSVWLGGLAALAGFLLRRADPRALRVILPVWSGWAAVAVCCLVTAGAVQSVVQVGAPQLLLKTDYGRLIIAKLVLVAGVLAVAAVSRRLVRRRAAAAGVPPLRRAVWGELGFAAVILAASAALAQTTPARSAAVEVAAQVKAKGFVTTLNSPLYAVQFEIFPVQLGENNTFHGFVYTPDGKPLAVAEWKVTAALPSKGIEPMNNPVAPLLGNQGLGGINFPIPGDWQLRLTIRISELDEATVTTTVSVP